VLYFASRSKVLAVVWSSVVSLVDVMRMLLSILLASYHT
jgi:hypothetical protein